MSLPDTLSFPRIDAFRPTDIIGTFLRGQSAWTGQVRAAQAGTAAFLAERLRKDAAFAATLATTRMPTAAARLIVGHMQETWVDYAGQAIRWGMMFDIPAAQARDDASVSVAVPVTADTGSAETVAAGITATQPAGPAKSRAAGSGKPPRGEPV